MFTRVVIPIADPATNTVTAGGIGDYTKVPYQVNVAGNGIYCDNWPSGWKVAFDDPSNEPVRFFSGHVLRRPQGFSRFFILANHLRSQYEIAGANMEVLVLAADSDVVPNDTHQNLTVSTAGGTLLFNSFRRSPGNIITLVQAAAGGNYLATRNYDGGSFRLLRYCITLTGNATLAAAGVLVASLQDQAGAQLYGCAHDFYLPNAVPAAPPATYSTGWVEIGGCGLLVPSPGVVGQRAKIAGYLSAALTNGQARFHVQVSEE